MVQPEFLVAFFAVMGVLSFIGIFVRRALRKPLRAALGDSYRKERTYAGVFEAIALDEDALRFAWKNLDGVLTVSAHEVVEISCEDVEKLVPHSKLTILTNKEGSESELTLFSFFRRDRLKSIAARLKAMQDRAKTNGVMAHAAPAASVAEPKALTENEQLTRAIERLTVAVTRLTALMGHAPPAGKCRPIRRK
jgi:hypothetical protein